MKKSNITLTEFLILAKKNTYAGSNELSEFNFQGDGKEFLYSIDRYKYRDCYYGYNPFIGEEIVWKNNKIYWAMNYYGTILDPNITPKSVYNFLKLALLAIPEEYPFRGPECVEAEILNYTNKFIGDINYFSGTEKIYQGARKIFELKYHGGLIKFK